MTPDPRRQAVVLLLVVDLLVLATGVVASIDLRRLGTPEGTALRWVEAAVFGDCGDYLEFSVPDPSVPDQRSRDQLCRDLRAATAKARGEVLRIGLRPRTVVATGHDATAAIVLTRDGRTLDLSVHLVRRHGTWRVVRDTQTCGSVGCA